MESLNTKQSITTTEGMVILYRHEEKKNESSIPASLIRLTQPPPIERIVK